MLDNELNYYGIAMKQFAEELNHKLAVTLNDLIKKEYDSSGSSLASSNSGLVGEAIGGNFYTGNAVTTDGSGVYGVSNDYYKQFPQSNEDWKEYTEYGNWAKIDPKDIQIINLQQEIANLKNIIKELQKELIKKTVVTDIFIELPRGRKFKGIK